MNTRLDYLFRVEPPYVFVGQGESERLKWTPSHFYARPGINTCVRRFRGKKMRTTQALMDEFAAALQFFDGFGENWYALQECLESLDEWLPADAYVLVVENAEELLQEEHPDQMSALLKTLDEAGRSWAKAISDNTRFNRRAIPFHVQLNVSDISSSIDGGIVSIAREAKIFIRE